MMNDIRVIGSSEKRGVNTYTSVMGPIGQWVLSVVSIAICLILIVFTGLFWEFGSVSAGFAFLQGHVVFVAKSQESSQPVNPGEKGSVKFLLQNLTGRAVDVYCANSSCGCVTPEDLPLRLGPGEVRRLRFFVATHGGEVRERQVAEVSLAFDPPGRPVLLRMTVPIRKTQISKEVTNGKR